MDSRFRRDDRHSNGPAAVQVPPAIDPADCERLAPAGRGAFTEVWRARHRPTGQVFALKQPRDNADPSIADRLLQNEAEILSRIAGPQIVGLVGAKVGARPKAIVLEWLEGESLEAHLARAGGPLNVRETLWIVRQCVTALALLADAAFVHGDLKPANIFLTTTGGVKLIDFGLAQPMGGASPRLVTGTIDYLAPEVLVPGNHVSIARDLYSLGLIAWQMLTGEHPFRSTTIGETLRAKREEPAPRLARIRAVPDRLADLLTSLLARQPLRRPHDLQQLERDLIELELAELVHGAEPASEAMIPGLSSTLTPHRRRAARF